MSTFLYCLKQGVINICRNIWFSLASVATISACIFLFCLFFAMVANVQHGARAAEETVGISVFFDEGMDEEQIRSIGSQIQSWSEVREARYISAEEAWESFKSEYFEGMEELAEGFEADNPLANSSSYEIYLKDISNQDMITPGKSKRKFGLYKASDSDKHLAMPVWHWGVFYEKLIQSIMSGSWSKDEDGDNVKALNYWWGMSAGVVDLIYSESLPSATKRLVKLFEKELKEARFRVFEGELKDQQGNIRVEEGKLIDPEHIITMDWLLDNVVGRLPRYNELTDNAKLKMALQGVVKEEE